MRQLKQAIPRMHIPKPEESSNQIPQLELGFFLSLSLAYCWATPIDPYRVKESKWPGRDSWSCTPGTSPVWESVISSEKLVTRYLLQKAQYNVNLPHICSIDHQMAKGLKPDGPSEGKSNLILKGEAMGSTWVPESKISLGRIARQLLEILASVGASLSGQPPGPSLTRGEPRSQPSGSVTRNWNQRATESGAHAACLRSAKKQRGDWIIIAILLTSEASNLRRWQVKTLASTLPWAFRSKFI